MSNASDLFFYMLPESFKLIRDRKKVGTHLWVRKWRLLLSTDSLSLSVLCITALELCRHKAAFCRGWMSLKHNVLFFIGKYKLQRRSQQGTGSPPCLLTVSGTECWKQFAPSCWPVLELWLRISLCWKMPEEERDCASPGFQTKNGGSLCIGVYFCPAQIHFLQNPEGLLQSPSIAGWKYGAMLFSMYAA